MAVTEKQVARINELAHKAKTEEGLTAEEKREQAELRSIYIESFRANLKSQLDNIEFTDGDDIKSVKKEEATVAFGAAASKEKES